MNGLFSLSSNLHVLCNGWTCYSFYDLLLLWNEWMYHFIFLLPTSISFGIREQFLFHSSISFFFFFFWGEREDKFLFIFQLPSFFSNLWQFYFIFPSPIHHFLVGEFSPLGNQRKSNLTHTRILRKTLLKSPYLDKRP